MATNKRTHPDDYFAWYNDDQRLGIVVKASSSSSTDGLTSGEYDTYLDSSVTKGLRIHFHSKFEELTTSSTRTSDLFTLTGLDSGMHPALINYVKYRLFEQQGNEQKAQYYYNQFLTSVKKYPSRKSGVRALTVPRI
mgnify:FL=1|jgi:hypothetical protein|tara:strand:- start:358 stop:768 length:411 start_codon:yes stop_codon:yes gene_type:complete